MDIRLPDKLSLTPLLLTPDGRPSRRVVGVIDGERFLTGGMAHRFVDALEYDGFDCHYLVDVAYAGASDDSTCRVKDDESISYRSFSRLIVDRLCTFDRASAPPLHRFPGGPPSRALRRRRQRLSGACTLTVIDTCVTPDGRLWLHATWGHDDATACPARPEGDSLRVDGWFVLAETASSIDGSMIGETSSVDRGIAA